MLLTLSYREGYTPNHTQTETHALTCTQTQTYGQKLYKDFTVRLSAGNFLDRFGSNTTGREEQSSGADIVLIIEPMMLSE